MAEGQTSRNRSAEESWDSRNKPHTFTVKLFFNKGTEILEWGKNSLFPQSTVTSGYPHMKEWSQKPIFHNLQKLTPKWTRNLHTRAETQRRKVRLSSSMTQMRPWLLNYDTKSISDRKMGQLVNTTSSAADMFERNRQDWRDGSEGRAHAVVQFPEPTSGSSQPRALASSRGSKANSLPVSVSHNTSTLDMYPRGQKACLHRNFIQVHRSIFLTARHLVNG